MKQYFLYKDGIIRHQHQKRCTRINRGYKGLHPVVVTMEDMHNAYIPSSEVEKDVFALLIKYGLKTTVFHCYNLQLYGFTQIYPYEVEIAVKNGSTIQEVD